MQLISKFLLCVIDIYSKYAWIIPLKDKKGITITNAFEKILNESERKSNKIWIFRFTKTNCKKQIKKSLEFKK